MTIIAARLDRLDPMQRLQFEEKVIRTWRITWPDGTTEEVQGHNQQCSYGTGTVSFYWHFLGPHRHINLAHVRDIEEIESA